MGFGSCALLYTKKRMSSIAHTLIFSYKEVIPLLYRIGSEKEIPLLSSRFPDRVIEEVLAGAVVRDSEYGADRDYLEIGGYSILLVTLEDIQQLKSILDYDAHPCEWATHIGSTGYVSALYILNDDYTIDVYMPLAIAPKAILKELED